MTLASRSGNEWNSSVLASALYFFESFNFLTRKFSGFGKITKTDDVGNVTKNYYQQGNSTDSTYGEYDDDVSQEIYKCIKLLNRMKPIIFHSLNEIKNDSLLQTDYHIIDFSLNNLCG